MMSDEDEVISRIVQQDMLQAGIWIRLHTEDGAMVMSEYVPAGNQKVVFAPPSAVGTIHFLSIAIDGKEIWRGPGTGLPCNIPEGGRLVLDDVFKLVREAQMMKNLEDMRKMMNEMGATTKKKKMPDGTCEDE